MLKPSGDLRNLKLLVKIGAGLLMAELEMGNLLWEKSDKHSIKAFLLKTKSFFVLVQNEQILF